MFIFRKKYCALTAFLFITELVIALFVHDSLIRPYGGDVLVVLLLFAFFYTFLPVNPLRLALAILIFACVVEILQLFHFAETFALTRNTLGRIILGSTFSFGDILSYWVGFFIICFLFLYQKLHRK
jgi:hypothetical protein